MNTILRRSTAELRSSLYGVIVEQDLLGIRSRSAVTWDPEERLDRFTRFARQNSLRAFSSSDPLRRVILAAYNRGRACACEELGSPPPVIVTKAVFGSQIVHELNGVVEAAIHHMVSTVSTSIAQNLKPIRMYHGVLHVIKRILRPRITTVSNTLVTSAYNGGKLDLYELFGLEKVGFDPEYVKITHDHLTDAKPTKQQLYQIMTAGDNKVCPICEDLEGEIVTINEARRILPVHPNCRCVVVPA